MATHTCGLCLDPLPADGLPYQVRLTTWTRRGRRGHCWSTRDVVCADCWPGPPERWQAISADGKREATITGTSERREIVQCQQCGITVSIPADARRKVAVCSDTCRSRYYGQRSARVAVTRHCEGCGGEMTGRADRRYCSAARRQAAYRVRSGST